ncbi:MAG: aryl-sulfate sulfohydrolase [Planctomycetes bacterium]|nr:aryl-sulfate sulfohydrolase [Planctomycetota bacterium]
MAEPKREEVTRWRQFALVMLFMMPQWATAAEPPNILFIYLDDFGWRDTGYMGSDFYETPHIDALARAGLVFSDAYSCAANCAPARACLLSGQYTPRHRIFNVGTRARGAPETRLLAHIPGTSTLRPDIVTWAESLQVAGYRTGMFGKWHLGTPPKAQGFDVAVNYRRLPGFKGHYGPDGAYLADVLTDRCISFIEASKKKRWCAYLAHFAVHTPLHAKPELLPKYQKKKPGKLHKHVKMATMIQAVDDGVGRLIAKLEALELLDNTVIIFYSDNGGYGPATDMDPLWGYKGTYYEGGIRVPFFVNWAGVVKPGETSEPITGVDLYPTLLGIAGAEPPHQALDGKNLVPLFKGEVTDLGERPLFWHFPAYLQSYAVTHEQRDPLFRTRPCSVIRKGRFKLHEYFEDGGLELYDLLDDIRERNNLADEMPDKRNELHRLLKDWRKQIGAPVPGRK